MVCVETIVDVDVEGGAVKQLTSLETQVSSAIN